MSSAWASAATGKPHVSYAERLRLAKESSINKTEVQAGDTSSKPISLSNDELLRIDPSAKVNDQRVSLSLSEKNSVGSSSVQQTSASMSPNPSSNNTAGTSSPARSVADLPGQSDSQSAKPAQAVVNIWEQRKKLREQDASDQRPDPSAQSTEKASVGRTTAEHQSQAKAIGPTKIAWGGVGMNVHKAGGSNSHEASNGHKQEIVKQSGTDVDGQGGKDWPSPLASTSRRRASNPAQWPASGVQREPGKARVLGDEVRSAAAEDAAENGHERIDRLDGLDVTILRDGSTERQRKDGKQWVSIIPTVTHSRQTPQRQAQPNAVRRGKGGGGGGSSSKNRQAVQTAKSSSAPQTPSSRSTESGSPRQTPQKAAQVNAADGASLTHTSMGRAGRRLGGSADGSPSRKPSQTRTTRGTRGRGGSKRAEENPTMTEPDDIEVDDDVLSTNDQADGVVAGLPDRPKEEREANGDDGSKAAPLRSQAQKNSGTTNVGKPQFGSPSNRRMTSPFLRSDRQWNNGRPYGPAYEIPIMESTPLEAVPAGTETTTEPTGALLWQIEFYFSHQNLQGDFYLRKSMDQHGFVPIDVVSTFNRVVRLTGKDQTDLVKRTLQYSKALQFNDDRTKIRKAYGWQPYVLTNGQHAQDYLPPFFVAPGAVPHAQHPPSTGFSNLTWGTQNGVDGGHPPHINASTATVGNAEAVVAQVSSNDEEEAEQSDETSVGVVAATGLGGMLNSTVALAIHDGDRE